MGLMIRKYMTNWLMAFKRDRSKPLHRIASCIRLYPVWRHHCFRSSQNALTDQVPWITFEAHRFVESVMLPNAVVFEYGSGGSTLYYARKAARVISVEHDPLWYERVETALSSEGVKNCELLLIPPQTGTLANMSPEDPQSYSSGFEGYEDAVFREYAASIDMYGEQFFDLVAIDGRARPSCLWHASRKVKIGGYLMLDNSERPHYERAKNLLSEWEKHVFYGPGRYLPVFWETTIWKRTEA